MRALALALALAAAPALAEAPMSPEAFEAYTTGKTLLYSQGGTAYGGEDYLPGRRVRWSFLDGHCLEGRWFDAQDLICFVYDDHPEEQICWHFFQEPTGLRAEVDGGEDSAPLTTTGEAQAPLFCLGPEVGV